MRVSMERSRRAAPVLGALAAALVFRLLVAAFFPFDAAGDTALYERLARGLRDHRTFGLEIGGRLEPVNVRMPGYPAFLAATESLLGPGRARVRVAQAVLDTATCALAGLAGAILAAPARRRRAFVAATWLAALCPFTANYAAAVLAETPGAFWTTASFVALAFGVRRADEGGAVDAKAAAALVAAGLAAGLGCYFRPETPILLAAPAVVLGLAWRRARDWPRLLATGAALGLGLAVALVPWGARNARAIGRFEVLPPPGANLPGEITGEGFDRWAATWLTANDEIYQYWFKLESEPIEVEALPPSAIDSPGEKARVAALFAQHNADLTMTREWDEAFAQLARERTARDPLRTYVHVPLARALALWTTPRVELLPFSGDVFPLGPSWREDPVDVSATVVLFFVGLLYPALAIVGGARASWRTGAALVGVYVVLRTALMTHVPGPEPRYVVVAFPLLCALAAQLWAEPGARTLAGSGTSAGQARAGRPAAIEATKHAKAASRNRSGAGNQ
jgi:hypothetical protein